MVQYTLICMNVDEIDIESKSTKIVDYRNGKITTCLNTENL